MALAGPDILLYEKPEAGIVVITMNRPERLNSLTIESFDRLNEAWRRFRDDDEARVAIITGAGDRAFCAGMDLKDQAERVAGDPAFDIVKLKPGVIDGSEGTPRGAGLLKPVIAAVNGVATAGGFQLVMTADLRIASENAGFGIGEVKVGRGTPWAVPLLWQMPSPIAAQLLYLGDMVPASRLYEVGWLNKVVPQDRLMTEAMNMARTLRDNAPLSVRAAKEMLTRTTDIVNHPGLELAGQIYKPVYASEDAAEGPRAFAEKRKPVWKGK